MRGASASDASAVVDDVVTRRGAVEAALDTVSNSVSGYWSGDVRIGVE